MKMLFVSATVGIVVSTMIVSADDATDTLPATSVVFAVMLWVPCVREMSMDTVPAAMVVADPTAVVPAL